MALAIDRIDHVVLTAHDVDRTIEFYSRVLGMEPVTFAGGRRGLAFGRQKINLHQSGREYEPKALKPAPGSLDLCFITETPLDDVIETSYSVLAAGELTGIDDGITEDDVEPDIENFPWLAAPQE